MTPIQFILIAGFGSFVQEVIHLYDIRTTLHLPDTRSILKSWQYWIITTMMILVSSVATWILYGDSLTIKSVILILGATFPLMFKKLVSSAGVNRPQLNNEPLLGDFSIRDYFI